MCVALNRFNQRCDPEGWGPRLQAGLSSLGRATPAKRLARRGLQSLASTGVTGCHRRRGNAEPWQVRQHGAHGGSSHDA